MFFNLKLCFLILTTIFTHTKSQCSKSCGLALGSYYVRKNDTLTTISEIFGSTDIDLILSYNKQVRNKDSIQAGTRIEIPFSCDCIDKEFLGHVFRYKVRTGDTYDTIANTIYSNLTSSAWLQKFNSYDANRIPDVASLNVTVNCSCGDKKVSKEYGLFVTYPLRAGDSLGSVVRDVNFSSGTNGSDLLMRYNPDANFSAGSGIVYVPGKDQDENFVAFKSSKGGLSTGGIAGIVVVAVVGLLLLVGYFGFYRKKRVEKIRLSTASEDPSTHAPGGTLLKGEEPSVGASPRLKGISVDKSVEFSLEELAKATNDFNISYKIGQGGFGAVYYAELRGEKAAIKKMDMQASKEFLAELKVLTNVHHLNLVRLIGYCVEDSLFLVYEYIENGNLSEHLRGSGRPPLSWSTRLQVALDSARGLEYIHEHTVPVYIHRDIKSANILIDKNYRGKVADFGLTKLTEVGSTSMPTRLVGTFGYMPPEYAQYGDVSPKVDVYAFGVVLYELISAKDAIVRANDSAAESKGLVAMFEEAFNEPDPVEGLSKLVDPRLGDDHPIDSVRKLAQLARACTLENPQLRPSMRSIVVALMTLSSSTGDWDIGSFFENHDMVNLMSGR
ncbi:Chitin elicitor receptor kinase 1 [Heracleum sosnowskyi]|uniref:non-specific serine/threonine protein kinase n=1 Tax=Heracleum sosnowskyi TaxID=360622 RepID=A0AAD8JMY0_9APIA|nr:Chitin elicitor receptor kinase 1 [Heracleum sosnowskyi]